MFIFYFNTFLEFCQVVVKALETQAHLVFDIDVRGNTVKYCFGNFPAIHQEVLTGDFQDS